MKPTLKSLNSQLLATIITVASLPILSLQAAVVPSHDIYYSHGQMNMTYQDPQLSKPIGTRLVPQISAWQTYEKEVDNTGKTTAYDLGSHQWVSAQFNAVSHEVKPGAYIYQEAFSAGQPIPVYKDPQLTQPIGKLSNKVADWQINRVDFANQSEYVYAVDLGNNQWAAADALYLLPKVVTVHANNTLVNQNGQPTGQITNLNVPYATYGVKSINQQTYIRLGNNHQWLLASQSDPALN